MRAQPAHHSHVRLHPVPLEAGAVEDAVICLDVEPVRLVQPGQVAVEGVRVLHDELARPQHSRSRPRLVSLLDLEVVDELRKVAIGANLARRVEGDVLLVGHGQDELRPAPVGELEQLVDVVAPRLSPVLGGLQDGHQELRRADRIELLAHDLLDLAMGTPAGRQPGPQAGAELAGQPGAHDQLVRHRLGIGGRLSDRWQEIARKSCQEVATINRKSSHSAPNAPI